MRPCNKKRSCGSDSNNDRKRRKIDTNHSNIIPHNSNNMNGNGIYYNAETTVQLANRLGVPVYAHKLVYHKVKWVDFMDNKNNLKNIDINAVEPNKDAFTLHHVLSKDECKLLIYLTEKHGYHPLGSTLKGKTNRTNTRVIIDDPSLSNLLFERVKSYLPSIYKIHGQIWKIHGLNSRFRFCKYKSGQQFKMHHDGRNGIKGQNIASFYTVNIYLNDGDKDFDGGRTIFYDKTAKHKDKQKYVESSAVIPSPGLFLVFNHYPNHYKHSGEVIKRGVKYIARTEAMYELIEGENHWKHKSELKKFKNRRY